MEYLYFYFAGWLVFLAGVFWYAVNMRHPARRPLNAFLLFLGVAEGVIVASVAGATTLVNALDTDHPLASALSQCVPVLVFGAIALGFLYARHLIRKPPRPAAASTRRRR